MYNYLGTIYVRNVQLSTVGLRRRRFFLFCTINGSASKQERDGQGREERVCRQSLDASSTHLPTYTPNLPLFKQRREGQSAAESIRSGDGTHTHTHTEQGRTGQGEARSF